MTITTGERAAPELRFAADWDNDLVICYDALPTDALNIMHTGLTTNKALVNLHWNYLSKQSSSGFTTVTEQTSQAVFEAGYGIKQVAVVVTSSTGQIINFGRDASNTNEIQVTNGATYTAVCWYKTDAPYVGTITFEMRNATASTVLSATSGVWTQATLTFTPTATRTAFKFTKNTSGAMTAYFAGFMIVAGSTAPGGFNVGESTNGYDVMTADVLSANWKLGKTSWREVMPAEGTVNLTLDNSARKYSPEYSSSPLYGVGQKLLFTIDGRADSSSAWVRLWAGWITNIRPQYGKNPGKTAEMTCEQGMFRLAMLKYLNAVSGTQTADTVISDVILRGYQSAVTPLQFLNNRSGLSAGYFVDPAVIMSLDSGVSALEINDEAWGREGNARAVIQDLLTIERGWFFIARDGVVTFYNRHHYVDPALTPATAAVSLDSDATSADYVYGDTYHNTIRVNYKPQTTENDILWSSRREIVVRAHAERQLGITLETDESNKLSAADISAFGTSGTHSSYTATNGTGDYSASVTVSVPTLQNGEGILQISNPLSHSVRVAVTLRGERKISSGGETVTVTDAAGVAGGVYEKQESVKLIQADDEALNYAQFLLNMYRDTVGQFLSYRPKISGTANYSRVLDMGIGSKVAVSEYQTAHAGTYIIAGEAHDYTPGLLNTTFTLEPLFRRGNTPWIVGTSVLGTNTYLGY